MTFIPDEAITELKATALIVLTVCARFSQQRGRMPVNSEICKAVGIGRDALIAARKQLVLKQFIQPINPPILPKKAVISDEVRWDIWERDNFTCKKCGARRHLTLDHVIPESLGGSSEPENLQTLCKPCNRAKGVQVELSGY